MTFYIYIFIPNKDCSIENGKTDTVKKKKSLKVGKMVLQVKGLATKPGDPDLSWITGA